jgi:hypothetical protein
MLESLAAAVNIAYFNLAALSFRHLSILTRIRQVLLLENIGCLAKQSQYFGLPINIQSLHLFRKLVVVNRSELHNSFASK